jgi:hypothetical protein
VAIIRLWSVGRYSREEVYNSSSAQKLHTTGIYTSPGLVGFARHGPYLKRGRWGRWSYFCPWTPSNKRATTLQFIPLTRTTTITNSQSFHPKSIHGKKPHSIFPIFLRVRTLNAGISPQHPIKHTLQSS